MTRTRFFPWQCDASVTPVIASVIRLNSVVAGQPPLPPLFAKRFPEPNQNLDRLPQIADVTCHRNELIHARNTSGRRESVLLPFVQISVLLMGVVLVGRIAMRDRGIGCRALLSGRARGLLGEGLRALPANPLDH